jgi:hypothetical protein
MRKNLLQHPGLFLSGLSLFLFTDFCEGQTIERSLIGTGGKISTVQQVELNYSIGELAVATLQGTGATTLICTEGFQQKQITDVKEIDLRMVWSSRLRADAYPNPVRNNLTVYVYDDNFDEYRVDLYDASERLLQRYTLQQNKLIIPMQQFPAGFYWLKFFNTRKQKAGIQQHFKPFKIIKVN